MIRKKNKFSRTRKPFELSRIKEENALVERYGLKNKKEIWKTLAKVDYYRNRAMALAKSPLKEQHVLFKKLQALGLKVEHTADVLGLRVENLLERRLPTIVHKKGLANTVKHARQLVSHKKILIYGKVVDAPSYLVPIAEENHIALKKSAKKPKPKAETTETAESLEEVKDGGNE